LQTKQGTGSEAFAALSAGGDAAIRMCLTALTSGMWRVRGASVFLLNAIFDNAVCCVELRQEVLGDEKPAIYKA
jgi:hypothetical protein